MPQCNENGDMGTDGRGGGGMWGVNRPDYRRSEGMSEIYRLVGVSRGTRGLAEARRDPLLAQGRADATKKKSESSYTRRTLPLSAILEVVS